MILILIGNMKKILYFSGIILLLFACTAELETPSDTKEGPASVLYASIDDGATTRVYLDDDYRVLWNSDDRISVFKKDTYNQEYKFDGGDGANAGTFSIVEDGKIKTSNDIDYLYAVYPYNASTVISNDGVLTVTLPAEQKYAAVSFGQGANTMIAVSEDNNMKFKNACGYLMFKLYGNGVNVKTVSLRGNNHEKIAGEATVEMSLGGTPVVTMSESATEEIVLTAADAVTIGSSSDDYTEFWFAIPPVRFTGGFTITVTDQDDNIFTKSTSSSLEVVRSYAAKMAPIEVLFPTKPYSYSYVDLGLSVMWATCNLGATSPEQYGDYYCWGELASKEDLAAYSQDNYKFYENGAYTKYTWDGNRVLEPEDDAATVCLGDHWRMPSREEYVELFNTSKTSSKWTTMNGVVGWEITSKTNGNSIFIPAGGQIHGGRFDAQGQLAFAWTRDLYLYNSTYAYAICIYDTNAGTYIAPKTYINETGNLWREFGLPIRPIYVETSNE